MSVLIVRCHSTIPNSRYPSQFIRFNCLFGKLPVNHRQPIDMKPLIILAWMLGICSLIAQELDLVTRTINTNRIEMSLVEEKDLIILAKPKATSSPQAIIAAAKRHGLTDKTKLKLVKWKQFEVPKDKSKRNIMKSLLNSGLFEYVQENQVYTVDETIPNDPLFNRLWGLTNISAHKAWDLSKEAPTVIAAVVDTGIDFTHPDLLNNLWTGPNGEHGYTSQGGVVVPGGVDDHGHGTHVAGTIGAVGNNGIGVTGIAWNTKIMAMKVLHSGSGTSIDIVNGYEKLAELKTAGFPILVSNHSYGGRGSEDRFTEDGFRLLAEADIFAAVSAGNNKMNIDAVTFVPATHDLPNIISTMATDVTDKPASFSNFGIARTDISAPGVDVISTTRNNTYSAFSGTSMASPHVCGVALLLRARNPNLSAIATRDLILDPGSYDSFSWLSNNTSARLNLDKAIRNPRLFENPFLVNHAPVFNSPPAYMVVSNQPATISATATDADGDVIRRWSGSTFTEVDYNNFFNNLIAKNGMSVTMSPDGATVTANPFSYQLASRLDFSVADGRGGGAVQSTGFEIKKEGALRRSIKIKTWTAKTNSSAANFSWVLDVEDTNKSDYLYAMSWRFGNPGEGAFGFTPSPNEQTTTLHYPLTKFSVRAFVMDKYYNFINTEPIIFPASSTTAPKLISPSAQPVEGNVPFDCVFDASASNGQVTHRFIYDLLQFRHIVGASSQAKFTNTFTKPEFNLFFIIGLNNNSEESDSVFLPVFASRFAELEMPPPPPPTLVAPTDLGAEYAGGRIWVNWDEISTGEDRFEIETQTKARSNRWTPWNTLAVLPANSVNYSFIPAKLTYRFRVRCCKQSLCSAYSNTDTVIVPRSRQ